MNQQVKYKSTKTPSQANTTFNTNQNSNISLLQLQQMTFALVDLNLYLDIYPDNADAIEDYNNLFKQYWEAKSAYEKQNGPLMNFGHCPVNYPFNWINTPWPWERAAN